MGIFDKLKSAATSAATGAISNLGNKSETFTFTALPESLAELQKQIEIAKAEIEKPFPYEDELNAMCKRLDELNAELNLDKRENELVDDAEEQGIVCEWCDEVDELHETEF